MTLAEKLKNENHLTGEQITAIVNLVTLFEKQNLTLLDDEVDAASERLLAQNREAYEVLAE